MRGAVAGGHVLTAQAGARALEAGGNAVDAAVAAALGLETAHRAFGRLPWRDLFPPAIEAARNGVELNDGQAYLHRILDLILRHTPEARAVYEQDNGPLKVGDTLVQRDLADTLEL